MAGSIVSSLITKEVIDFKLQMADAQDYGYWAEGCGYTYLFGSKLVRLNS
jgi:hypothetical protein